MQRGVHVGAADGLDEGARHVVVLVAVAVVRHGRAVDGLLQGLEGDLRLPLVERRAGGGLQGGQGAAGVSPGDAQQVPLGVLGEGDGLLEAALLVKARRSRPRRSSSVSGSRVRRRERDSGEITEKYGFSVVAAINVTQRFYGREQEVLLGLAEAVDLVQEEDGLLAEAAGGAACAVDDRADFPRRPR